MFLRERSDYYERLAWDNLKAGDVYVDITDKLFKNPAVGIKKSVIGIAQRIRQKTGWEIRIFYYSNIQAEEEYYGEVRTKPYYIIARVIGEEVPRKKLFGIFPRKPRTKKVTVVLANIDDEGLESIFGWQIYFHIYNSAIAVAEIIKKQALKYRNISGRDVSVSSRI